MAGDSRSGCRITFVSRRCPKPPPTSEMLGQHLALVAELWLVQGSNQDQALANMQETYQRLLWAKQDARTEAPNDQRPNTLRV
jgi:hypothetical protein